MTTQTLTATNRLLLQHVLQATISSGTQVTTRWSVITGAPGSGKSTLIGHLRSLGYCVVEDQAREVLQARVRSGLSKHAARTNYADVQNEILRKMEESAGALDPQRRVFFDYAPPDNLAFLVVSGVQWTLPHLQAACRYRYEHVFLLDLLDPARDVDLDPVRLETPERKRQINAVLGEIYRELGVTITRIPPGDVGQRAKILLQRAIPEIAHYR